MAEERWGEGDKGGSQGSATMRWSKREEDSDQIRDRTWRKSGTEHMGLGKEVLKSPPRFLA